MADKLVKLLEQNRARLFVGRSAEIARFDDLLSDDSSSRLLFVHGPAGIGKTTLLNAMAARASELGWAVARFDARLAPADPAIAATALDQAIAVALSDGGRRACLVIDTFESWAAIEAWLRDQYLPGISTGTRVVIAGRRPPGMRWRADPGWQSVLSHFPLPPLSADECREYLRRRAVPEGDQPEALRVARGLPLLLALVADALEASTAGTDEGLDPNDVEALRIDLVDHVVPLDTRAAERDALFACALLRHTNEPLLAATLGIDTNAAAPLYAWLRGLSFIESNPLGLFPHDAMRDALRTALENRLPEFRLQLLDRAVNWYMDRIRGSVAPNPIELADHLFLYMSFMPQVFGRHVIEAEPAYAAPATSDDAPTLRRMVERNEGARAAALFDFWWAEQPEATRVVRGSEGESRGFFTMLEIQAPKQSWLLEDELLARLWEARSGMARPWQDDDLMVFVRMWMDESRHMRPSAIGPLWSITIMNALLSNPRVVWVGVRHPDDDSWRLNSRLYGHRELPGSRERAGRERVVVTTHDLSRETAIEWLETTYHRFRGETEKSGPVPPRRIDPAWVRAALRNLHRPDRLSDHPLLSRIDSADPVEALLAAVRHECLALRGNAKTDVLFRVLDTAYLNPAVDQRAAADACPLSYDQYRRRLTEGIRLVTVRLERALR